MGGDLGPGRGRRGRRARLPRDARPLPRSRWSATRPRSAPRCKRAGAERLADRGRARRRAGRHGARRRRPRRAARAAPRRSACSPSSTRTASSTPSSAPATPAPWWRPRCSASAGSRACRGPALAAFFPNAGRRHRGARRRRQRRVQGRPTWSSSRTWARCYARYLLGRENPRVGLLSIGEEETKGNDLVLEALPLLRARARI